MTLRNRDANGSNGRPSSGHPTQFAEKALAESSTTLTVDDTYWGDTTNVREGSRTPWGSAQVVDHVADGITVVHCAGHGGLKLSPERNKAVPAPLRQKSGWYEEDCEASIVGWVHPEAFGHYLDSDDERRDYFEASIKNWYPYEYTKATGNPVTVEESSVLRERMQRENISAFRAQHGNDFITTNVVRDTLDDDWLPDGYRLAAAKRDATGEERYFLLPEHEAVKDSMLQRDVLIDPKRHLDVTDVVNTQIEAKWPFAREEDMPATNDLGISYDHLTPAAADRARKELDQRFRFDDGNGGKVVETFGEHLARVGVKSKSVHHAGEGKSDMTVTLADGYHYGIKKAAFDALTGVPDVTRRTTREAIAFSGSAARMKKMNRWADPDKYDKASAKHEALHAEYRKVLAETDAEAALWQDQMRAARKAAFDRLVAERGIEF